MAAKLFFATGTVETLIGCGGKTLRMQTVGDFPTEQKRESATQQAVGVEVWNQCQGGEHHGEIPIVNAAGSTATVFHEPRLKRAEEKNANDVAYREPEGNQNQDSPIQNAEKIQNADHSVESEPSGGDSGGLLWGLIDGSFADFNGNVIFPKLLLTAHAFPF